ncbi:unnamed protein product [Closterium sp. NIES-64]|nr:unnamed protein product [Closterium sp. NIES-64]
MQLTAVLHFTDATIRAHDAALVHRHLVGAQPALAGAVEALLGLAQRVHASDADVLAALVDALADAAHPSPLVRAESIAVLQAFASLHAPSTRSHLPLLHAAARESAHRGVQMVAVRALADLLAPLRPALAPAGGEAQRAAGARGGGRAAAEGSVDVLLGLVPLTGWQVDVEAVKEDVQRIGRQVEGEDEGEAEGVVGVVGMVRGGRAVRGAVQAAAGGRVYLCPGAAEDEVPRTRQMLAEPFNRRGRAATSRLLLPVLLHLWLHKAAAAVRQPAVRASQLLLSVMLAHGAHGLVEVPLRASQQDDVKCLGIVAH